VNPIRGVVKIGPTSSALDLQGRKAIADTRTSTTRDLFIFPSLFCLP
jgi:hypothetical protein